MDLFTLKKKISPRFLIIICLLLCLYLLFRSINLTTTTYFGDEAEYMGYAQAALHDASQRFISLEVGKQPLFIWIAAFFIYVFSDPLIAGRLVSVSAGLLTMIGIWLLTWKIFNDKNISHIAALIFILFPLAQLYNRLGNFDSTVGMFYVWGVLFTLILGQTIRLDGAYTLGMIIAGGMLTKTNAFFLLYLLPSALLVFDFKNLKRTNRLIKLFLLFLLVAGLANLLYAIVYLSPLHERILWFNGAFVYPKREWLTLTLDYKAHVFLNNFLIIMQFLLDYITIPYLILLVLTPLFIKRHMRKSLFLLVYSFIPLFALAVFARGIGSRWIYPYTLTLIPLIAFSLASIYKHINKLRPEISRQRSVVIVFLLLLYPAFVVSSIAISPLRSYIPPIDKEQYFINTRWCIQETMPEIDKLAKNRKVFVATQGLQDVYALRLYAAYPENTWTKVFALNDLRSELAEINNYAKRMPTYFVSYDARTDLLKDQKNVKIIKEKKYENTSSHCEFKMYQING